MKKLRTLSCAMLVALAGATSVRADLAVVRPYYWILNPDIQPNIQYAPPTNQSSPAGANPSWHQENGDTTASSWAAANTGAASLTGTATASARQTNYYKRIAGPVGGKYYKYWMEHTVTYSGNLAVTATGAPSTASVVFKASGFQQDVTISKYADYAIPATTVTSIRLPVTTGYGTQDITSNSAIVSVESSVYTAGAATYVLRSGTNTITITSWSLKSEEVPPDDF